KRRRAIARTAATRRPRARLVFGGDLNFSLISPAHIWSLDATTRQQGSRERPARESLSTVCAGLVHSVRPVALTRVAFLHLQDVALVGERFVEHRIDKESKKEPRDEAGDDNDGERLLRVRADTGRERGGQQTETSDKRGHHDWTKAEERGFECSRANRFALQ